MTSALIALASLLSPGTSHGPITHPGLLVAVVGAHQGSKTKPVAKAAMTVAVDVKDGDTLTGERTFRVTVNTEDAVNQVEFYVGNDLRDSDTSTPYEFRIDTLSESEGPIKLRFKAYTVENKTAEKTVSLVIDNGLGKGVAFHLKRGEDYLADSKWQNAIDEGRIALKIDSANNPARLILARANLGLGVYDKAQKFAEDAVAKDANDVQALQLLAAINLNRSFSTVAREGTDRKEVLDTIREALKSAVDSRRKALDIEVDKAGSPSDANLLPYVDAVLKAERFSLAIAPLQTSFSKDNRNVAVANRLAYALLRANRPTDALAVVNQAKKYSQLDAYSYGLLGVIAIEMNDDAASDDAIREAVLSDSDNLGVRTAQAYIALKRNKTAVLAKLATDLQKEQGQRADVNYFLMALSNRLQRYSEARRYFQRAVLAEPAYPDLYVEQGNYSIGLTFAGKLEQKDLDFQYDNAEVMYQAALQARPEAVDALSGLALVNLFKKQPQDALRYGTAAVRAAPNDAGAHYVLSAVYTILRQSGLAQKENDRAGQLDRKNLEGRELPNPAAVYRYLNTGGRAPVISAPR